MSLGAIRPRPDQIAELTRGLELPLPEISEVQPRDHRGGHFKCLQRGSQFITRYRDLRK